MTLFSGRRRPLGPGSHPASDRPRCMEIPREVPAFAMPLVPEGADAEAMTAARDRIAGFLALLDQWNPEEASSGPKLALEDLSPAALEIVDEMLGEGEVSIRIAGGRDVQIQESVFTGLWRVREHGPDGVLIADMLEAAPVPGVVGEAARAAGAEALAEPSLPAGVMNAPAVLREIETRAREWRRGDPPYVINLTLLPLSPADHAVLEQAFPPGPVAIVTRGFGSCELRSTGVRQVWRLRHFNSVKTLIQSTIIIADVPEEAAAAPEDLEDSRQRLAELITWMSESCAT